MILDFLVSSIGGALVFMSVKKSLEIVRLYRQIENTQKAYYLQMQELDEESEKLANYHPVVAEEIENSPALRQIKKQLRKYRKS